LTEKKQIGKPEWVKKRLSLNNKNIEQVRDLLLNLNLNTVCQSAKCPNIFECFSKRTATFMILGNTCTRNCAFCGVSRGQPAAPDTWEPSGIAMAAKELGLEYIVLTSVTRDDLSDGGAGHFASTVREIKKIMPEAKVECLIPDFKGKMENLKLLLEEELDVLNHNMETVKKNYGKIRNGADYERSLGILKTAKILNPQISTKSGFMLGLGENLEEVTGLLSDLKSSGCDIVTIGQYLRPAQKNYPVRKYYSPEEFESIRQLAETFNFRRVLAGVFVRSSYHASEVFGCM